MSSDAPESYAHNPNVILEWLRDEHRIVGVDTTRHEGYAETVTAVVVLEEDVRSDIRYGERPVRHEVGPFGGADLYEALRALAASLR